MQANRFKLLSVCAVLTSCAHVSMIQYPTITGTIVRGSEPAPSLKVRIVQENWELAEVPCEGKSRTTKTSKTGEFRFDQKNISTFITPFNFESSSDKLMEDHTFYLCILEDERYIPILEMDGFDLQMHVMRPLEILCNLEVESDPCETNLDKF